jgi:tetratricopeptide (TPR) repeat protein
MFAFLSRNGRALLVTLGALAWSALPFAAFSQPRPQLPEAALTASLENGFARLVFTFPQETKADVQLANNVLVIRFAKPLRVPVEHVQGTFKEFVQAVRADPDGAAVRIAFAQKITVNTMEAGEKLFVDILPESWSGLPPSLPQDVVDDLAKRARDAERKARMEYVQPRIWQPVKLRFAEAPGFTRFAFTLSEPMPIKAEQDGQELKITFNAPVKIDLGEARVSLPPSVVALDTDYTDAIAAVRIVLAPNASVRHFREESAFVVDVTPPPPVKPEQIQGEVEQPQTSAQAKAAPQTAAVQPQQNTAAPTPIAPQVAQTPHAANAPKEQPATQAMPEPLTTEVRASVTLAPNGIRIAFPFEEPVASAVFRRGDRIWIVFDTKRSINVSDLTADKTRSFSDVSVVDTENGKAVRLKLKGGWLTSVQSDGLNWTVHFGDAVVSASRPLIVQRMSEENGAVLAVPVEKAASGKVHHIEDAEIGDDIQVITAVAPVRGVLRAQDFLEFKILPSAHGVALLPLADDVQIVLKPELVLVGRPKGLSLSTAQRAPNVRPDRVAASPLDAALWEAERNRRFAEREAEILAAAADAPANQRSDSRMMLATFYLANNLATEAKGALEWIVREDAKTPVNARFHLLRGLSELMIGRPTKALEHFANSELADSQDAALLRAVAYAELSAWTETREHFRAGAAGLKLLPVDLQRRVLLAVLRAAVEVRDFTEAGRLMNELDATEVPEEMAAQFAVLAGRVAEGLGRADRAEGLFETAAKSNDGPAAAEARYKQVELKLARGEYNRAKAIDRLEALAFVWRGDRVELESSRLLARLYVEEARYRDAFRLLDAALLAQPNAPVTRTFQNEMAVVFEDLFLSGKADALPPIEALALYYDFSKLTPIGRRGDELIRRLSERLVAVDLLDQASELLEHQVQFRLTGAAKSQVATRLAIVHLMNRKPQKAIAILAATRLADLPRDMREQRLLLESRALMSANRFDQAIDVLASVKGPEVDRMRADVLWQAKRWRQAGEAIETLLGERWKEEEALNDVERHDVLRAGLAYALAGETLALTRLKEKFANKLNGAPEKAAFDQIAANPNPRAIGAATKALSSIDSLSVFLKMYQAKYPTAQMPMPADQLTAR